MKVEYLLLRAETLNGDQTVLVATESWKRDYDEHRGDASYYFKNARNAAFIASVKLEGRPDRLRWLAECYREEPE